MKKIIYATLGLIVLSSGLQAKKVEVVKKKDAFTASWQKIYGGKDDDIASSIVALENGDSALVGSCKSYDANKTDICVLRMNNKGEMKWRLWLGGKKSDFGKSVTRSADGNILVLGKSKSFSKNYDYDLYVAKVSLDGKLIWKKDLGGNRDESAGGIVGTNDGGSIIVGDSESFSDNNKDIYIVKLDKNGKIISEKTLGGKKADSLNAITRTKDNNFVAVGYREVRRNGDKDFFILKLDQNAKTIWHKRHGQQEPDSLLAVTATIDGGIVATGKTRSYGSKQTDLSVMKLNANGKVIWHKLYGFKYYEYGNAVTMTRDGGFVIAGGTDTLGKGNHSAYILALDKAGKLIWSHVYGDEWKDIAHGVALMSDGSVTVVGETESFSKATDFYMINLVKGKE